MAGFLKIASFALLVSNTHGSGSWEGEFEDEESGSWIGSGSQEGECDDGYDYDGTSCVDVDECTDGVDNCDANAACTNTVGNFTCACNSGYTGDGTSCTPVPVGSTVTHKWTATPYSPVVCPTPDTCGAQSPRTRTVTCQATTTDADGGVTRADAAEAACTETKPAESDACPIPAEGDACDDGDAETMNDACDASAACAGKVTLKAAVTFTMDTSDLDIPEAGEDVDASPLATAVKGSLVTALASAMTGLTADDITILSLSTARRRRRRLQTGLAVDYKIEVPAAEATTAVKEAATTAAEAITTVTIPAAATVSGTDITPTVTATAEAFVSYSYVKTAGTCPSAACSDACDATEVTAADAYACHADGVAEADSTNCDGAGLTAPTSATVCCAAADTDTCIAAPSPEPEPEPEPTPDPDPDPDPVIVLDRGQQSAAPVAGPAATFVAALLSALLL